MFLNIDGDLLTAPSVYAAIACDLGIRETQNALLDSILSPTTPCHMPLTFLTPTDGFVAFTIVSGIISLMSFPIIFAIAPKSYLYTFVSGVESFLGVLVNDIAL